MNLLTGAAREQGTTVILVTHEARVAAYADRRGHRPRRHGHLAHRASAAVIRLGLRLAVSGGREAVVRLVILAAAVGLGVGLLLTAVSGDQRGQRAERPVRLAVDRTPAASQAGSPGTAARAARTDPLWWLFTSATTSTGRPIVPGRRRRHRADLAGAAGHPPRPRTGPVLRLSGAGQRCCAAPRRTSSPTATPAAWRADRRGRACRPRTRWSSSSGAPPRSWLARPAPSKVTAIVNTTPPQRLRRTKGCRSAA